MKIINKFFERDRKLKKFIILATVLVILGIIISSNLNTYRKSFSIDGLKFKYKELLNGTYIFVDENDEILKAYNKHGKALYIFVDENDKNFKTYNKNGRALSDISNTLIIEYKGKVIRKEPDEGIYVNDSLVVSRSSMSELLDNNGWHSGNLIRNSEKFEVKLIKKIVYASRHILNEKSISIIFRNSFILIFGASLLIFPGAYWEIEHYFSVQGGEPTNFYIRCAKLCGILLILGVFILSTIGIT